MIVVRRWPVRVAEAWFDDADVAAADVVHFRQWSRRPPGKVETFMTHVLDLERDPEDLLAAMNATTRNEVRRAVRDDGLTLRTHLSPDDGSMHEFRVALSAASIARGASGRIGPALDAYRAVNALLLTAAVADTGEVLVWHAYLRQRGRVRLLHSAPARLSSGPEQRKALSRANRWLHWSDIESGKAAGCTCLDLGGWYDGRSDAALLAVNKFKEGLGGTLVTTYNSTWAASRRGGLYERVRDRVASH